MPNISESERRSRVIAGVAMLLLTLIFRGPVRLLGLLGFAPLLTGLLGVCPLYGLLKVSTYRPRRNR